jgi:hypothetical protein
MELCSKKHDEVCYEGRVCPACDLLDIIKQLEGELKGKDATIEKLNNMENE